MFDLELDTGIPCYISSISISHGENGPQNFEILVSSEPETWEMLKQHNSTKSAI